MSYQIKRKYVLTDAIDGSKIRLENNQAVRALKADGTAESLFKLDADNKLQFLVLPQVNFSPVSDNDVSRKKYVDDQLSAEASARQSADTTLDGKIDQEISDRQSAVSAEELARIAADGLLDDKIDQEISDRVAAVSAEESARISAVSAEESARIAADGLLDDKIDQEISDRVAAVSAEESARIAADGLLDDKIDQEISDRQTAITNLIDGASSSYDTLKKIEDKITFVLSNTDGAALDSLSEIVQAFQNADSDINSAITTLANSASSNLSAEESARIAEDLTFLKLDGSRAMTGNLNMDYSAIQGASSLSLKDNAESAISATLDGQTFTISKPSESKSVSVGEDGFSVSNDTFSGEIYGNLIQFNHVSSGDYGRVWLNPADHRLSFLAPNGVTVSGDMKMGGTIDMDGNFIQNLNDAIDPQDAVTKSQLDSVSSALTAEGTARMAEDETFLKLDGSRPMQGPLYMSYGEIREVNGLFAKSWESDPNVGTFNHSNLSFERSDNNMAVAVGLDSGANPQLFMKDPTTNLEPQVELRTDYSGLRFSSAMATGQAQVYHEVDGTNKTVLLLAGTGGIKAQNDLLMGYNAIGQVASFNAKDGALSTTSNTIDGQQVLISDSEYSIMTSMSRDGGFVMDHPVNQTYAELQGVSLLLRRTDAVGGTGIAAIIDGDGNNALSLGSAGRVQIETELNMGAYGNNKRIVNVADAIDAQDAVTKSQLDSTISNLINGAPEALDTLKEISDQLANDESVVSALITTVASNLVEAKAYTDSEVASEEAARIAGDASTLSSAQSYTDTEVASEEAARIAAVSAEQSAREAADTALDGRIDALEASLAAVQPKDESFTLTSTDITNGYVDLLVGEVVANSYTVFVGRLGMFEGEDFTTSVVSGKVRLTFAGSMATGQDEALEAGDVLRVRYWVR